MPFIKLKYQKNIAALRVLRLPTDTIIYQKPIQSDISFFCIDYIKGLAKCALELTQYGVVGGINFCMNILCLPVIYCTCMYDMLMFHTEESHIKNHLLIIENKQAIYQRMEEGLPAVTPLENLWRVHHVIADDTRLYCGEDIMGCSRESSICWLNDYGC